MFVIFAYFIIGLWFSYWYLKGSSLVIKKNGKEYTDSLIFLLAYLFSIMFWPCIIYFAFKYGDKRERT